MFGVPALFRRLLPGSSLSSIRKKQSSFESQSLAQGNSALYSQYRFFFEALCSFFQTPTYHIGAKDGYDYKFLHRAPVYDSNSGDDTPSSPRQSFSEMDGRLSSLFGSGWFFEWPGGKRPLNSTWPWADVKPSLLVLWGVCWMFVVTPIIEIPGGNYSGRNQNQRQSQRSPLQPNQNNYYYAQSSGGRSPIVKRESFGHGSDWPAVTPAQGARVFQAESSPLDAAAFTLFTQATQTQPIVATNAHQYHHTQLGQADTRAAPLAMRSTGVRITTTLPPNHGCLDDFANTSTDGAAYAVGGGTNTSTSSSRNYPSSRASASVSVARARTNSNPRLPHDTSGFDPTFTNHHHHPQQHHQQRQYYEASRHKPQQYQRSPASLTPLSAATPTGAFYNFPPGVDNNTTMSLSYENPGRTFPNYPAMMHEQPPQEHDDSDQQQLHRYPSPGAPPLEHPYQPPGVDAATAINVIEMPELPHKEESEGGSPGRSRPIPKPDREVTKNEEGRFVCTWAGCTEEVKSFTRKCEWSKHMDKHDRPYKCPAEGCEKLPGFTYSGGLLRHQREVHNLHGGPRKQLNCPHPNCKRHSGKGFSRQENLNEHLRRVHTDAGQIENAGDETEDDGSERAALKRKRISGPGPGPLPGRADEVADMRSEIARLSAEAAVLRAENDELRRNAELQQQQQQQTTNDLMRQMAQLRSMVGVGTGQAPQALM